MHNIPYLCGLCNSELKNIHNLHISGNSPQNPSGDSPQRLCCIHETLFDDVPWRKDVVDEDVRFADGLMYPSDRPGLGIELNEAAAAAHPKADHWLRHYAGTLTSVRPPDSVRYYHA